ncbi:hypothetical protein ACFLXO_03885 [Chloroflexota bacterium]
MATRWKPFDNFKTEACFRHCERSEAISRLGIGVMVKIALGFALRNDKMQR